MPNTKTHIKAGAITGLLTGAALDLMEQEKRKRIDLTIDFNWKEFLSHCAVGLGAGITGGVLPDILEPAYHSHHRNICHSMTAFLSVGYGTKKVAWNEYIDPYIKTAIAAAGTAYLSHLILDAGTSRGVPLLA